MNVFMYIAIVTAIGVALAYVVGRCLWMLGPLTSVLLFLPASIFLGIFLAFSLPSAVSGLCAYLGISERDCIKTDDRTVWFLVVPLVAFPVYALVMFVARIVGKASRERKLREA